MKILLYIIYGLLFLLIGILIARFILGGPGDSWKCENGAWMKHGNPRGAMPTTGCGITGSGEEYVLPDINQPD